jgi:hypothetical protein
MGVGVSASGSKKHRIVLRWFAAKLLDKLAPRSFDRLKSGGRQRDDFVALGIDVRFASLVLGSCLRRAL